MAAPKPAPSAPKPAAAPAVPAVALCREEIIDDKNRLCGYRFALQGGSSRAVQPEAEFLENLVSANIPEFAAKRLAVIPVSLDAVTFQRHLPLVAPNTVFVFDRAQFHGSGSQLAGRLVAIKEAGCKVGVRHVGMAPDDLPLLEVADVVFIDIAAVPLVQFQALVRELRACFPKIALAADGVESWDEQRMCLATGCGYCLGHFLTTKDKEDPDGKIDQGRLTAMEMLNLLKNDAELEELTEVAKHDPGITFQLLQLANSPVHGHATKITSLNQAIIVLGRNTLYRWLTVSMFRLGTNRTRDESLLEVALTRARFLETVCARQLPSGRRDELFIVGLLSLFDVLLGVPMPVILDKMQLSEEVSDVLLRSSGPFGPYLMMALTLERGLVDRAAQIARTLGLDPDDLGACSSAAFNWAQESLKN
jgi:EAL and modified HD-GYP domain-containing signal transduction protein